MSVTTMPSMEHTFTITIKGNRTKRVYDGTFTFSIPTLKTESDIEKTKTRLNEGLSLNEELDFLHEMVAFLFHSLSVTPEWWKKDAARLDIHDSNVYVELYQECMKFQKDWQDKVWGDDSKTEHTSDNKKG